MKRHRYGLMFLLLIAMVLVPVSVTFYIVLVATLLSTIQVFAAYAQWKKGHLTYMKG